jgi:3-methyladenine DNA glycosylase/8-oxoguanine DNA glycosylase
MTIQESEYRKVGKNNLDVPSRLTKTAISLQKVGMFKFKIQQPFNRLYTLWKPSHFFTGLEVHSKTHSWRTFRLNKSLFTAAKMYMKGSILSTEIYANKELSEKNMAQLRTQITRAYGLDETYTVPKKLVNVNKYVCGLFPKLAGTRISCPENFFEISIVSLLLQNTNISRTTSMFKKLIESYGRLVVFDNMALYSFYSPTDVLNVTEKELKERCRLGYRAKYIRNYAEFFKAHPDDELRELGKDELLELLETIKGVGSYTSNIVASSALRDMKAIPFDAWNRKILALKLYDVDPGDTEKLRERIFSDFGEYSGLIAMYVIENEYAEKPVVPLFSQ